MPRLCSVLVPIAVMLTSESGGGSVTYSIISLAGPFKLSADGTKVLTNGLAVNFEAQNSYTLTVQAESAGNYETV